MGVNFYQYKKSQEEIKEEMAYFDSIRPSKMIHNSFSSFKEFLYECIKIDNPEWTSERIENEVKRRQKSKPYLNMGWITCRRHTHKDERGINPIFDLNCDF